MDPLLYNNLTMTLKITNHDELTESSDMSITK